MEAFSQLRILFPDDYSACVKLTKEQARQRVCTEGQDPSPLFEDRMAKAASPSHPHDGFPFCRRQTGQKRGWKSPERRLGSLYKSLLLANSCVT